MDSYSSSVAEDYRKIELASSMEANDILFKNISNLIEYRKHIAINIKKCTNEEQFKVLKPMFLESSEMLKQLLGI